MLRIRVMASLLVGALAAMSAWGQQGSQPKQGDSPAGTQAQVGTGSQAPSSNLHHPVGIMPMRGVNQNSAANTVPAASSNPQNMMYFGGAVFAKATTYALWWGNPGDFAADERDGIEDILQSGFGGSAYLALADQYLFGRKAQTHFGGSLFDSSAPPTQDPPTSEIVTEVYSVLSDNGKKPDPSAVYMVFTSNFPNENYYCAYHDYGIGPDGTAIHVIFVPNSTNQPLCWVQPPELSCNHHSNGLQAAANSVAHELMESITDPNTDAWFNALYNDEIGDPCNFTYKRCVNLANETVWQLQEIWSNKVGACVQGAGSPDE
jgi:hypothetical protein